MAKIFVSYSSEDRETVRELVRFIEENGHVAWWDRDIAPGTRYEERIEKELDSCDVVLVVWSSSSIGSPWVRAEAQEGLGRGILIPVAIEDVRPPMAFRAIEAAQLLGWPEVENPVELQNILIGANRLTQAGGQVDLATQAVRDDPTLSERVAHRLSDTGMSSISGGSPTPLAVERAISDLLIRTLTKAATSTTSLKTFGRHIAKALRADHAFLLIEDGGHSITGLPRIGSAMAEFAARDAAGAVSARHLTDLTDSGIELQIDWIVYLTTQRLMLVVGGQGLCASSPGVLDRLAGLADLDQELMY